MHLGRVLALTGGLAIIAGGTALSPVAAGGLITGAALALTFGAARYCLSIPKKLPIEQEEILQCRRDDPRFKEIEDIISRSKGGDLLDFTPENTPSYYHTGKGMKDDKACMYICDKGQPQILRQAKSKHGHYLDPRLNDDKHNVRFGATTLYPQDDNCRTEEGAFPEKSITTVDFASFAMICVQNSGNDHAPVRYSLADDVKDIILPSSKE